MEENWSLAYSTGKLYEAEILKEVLWDNGIDAFIVNKQDSFYHFGDIEVFVKPDDIMRAKVIVEKFEK